MVHNSQMVTSIVWKIIDRMMSVGLTSYEVVLFLLHISRNETVKRSNGQDMISTIDAVIRNEAFADRSFQRICEIFKHDLYFLQEHKLIFDDIMAAVSSVNNGEYSILFEDILNIISTNNRSSNWYKQPEALTKLIFSLSKYSSQDSVYNPFAGVASYGVQIGEGFIHYAGEEINDKVWAVGYLRLMAHNIDASQYRKADSITEWQAKYPDNANLPKYDIIISTPPFGVRLNKSIGSECEPYNMNTSLDEVFLTRSLYGLSERGRLVGLFSTRILFANGLPKLIREKTIQQDLLETVILLPQNTLPGTSIPSTILLYSKNKARKGYVTIVDASTFYTKSKRRNELDVDSILNLTNTLDEKFVRVVSNSEIEANDYNINPARYFQKEEVLPEGYKTIKLSDIAKVVTGSKLSCLTGKIVNIGDLSANSLDCEKDIVDLADVDLKPNFRMITEPVLVLSMVRTLKPTYFQASVSNPIYVSPNVLALSIDSSKIDVKYLAFELARKSETLQIGAVIPRFNRTEILNLHITVPDIENSADALLREKADIEKALYANKEAMVRELGLSAVIDAQKQELFTLISHRKHRINPYFSGMQDNLTMLRDELTETGSVSLDHKISSNYTVAELLGNLEQQIAEVKALFKNLTSELVVDEKSTFDFEKLVTAYKYVSKNPNLHLDIVIKGDGSNCGLDMTIVSSPSSIKELIDIVIENAERHAFAGRKRGNIEIVYGENKESVYVQILNDGIPLGEDFNEELSFSEGYTYSNTGNSGKGLFRAKQICLNIGAEIRWVNNPNDIFATGILISIKNI